MRRCEEIYADSYLDRSTLENIGISFNCEFEKLTKSINDLQSKKRELERRVHQLETAQSLSIPIEESQSKADSAFWTGVAVGAAAALIVVWQYNSINTLDFKIFPTKISTKI